ncbi:MAG: hypothetical protein GY788_06560, partial [bacterium]|nr:hypothetical protein [bacterium]
SCVDDDGQLRLVVGAGAVVRARLEVQVIQLERSRLVAHPGVGDTGNTDHFFGPDSGRCVSGRVRIGPMTSDARCQLNPTLEADDETDARHPALSPDDCPYLLEILFWAGIGGTLYGTYWLVAHDHWAWWLALVFGTLLTRVIFEFGLLAFRQYDCIADIRDILKQAVTVETD